MVFLHRLYLLVVYCRKPLLVVNEQGIDYSPVGIIAWQDIEEVGLYAIPTGKGNAYGFKIRVKHPEPYSGKLKPRERKRFLTYPAFEIHRFLLPMSAKKLVGKIKREYGRHYLFDTDDQGISTRQFGMVLWQDIENLEVFYEFPFEYGLAVKLKHTGSYLANIPPHERKAFRSSKELKIYSENLPIPAKELVKRLHQEYGSRYRQSPHIEAAAVSDHKSA